MTRAEYKRRYRKGAIYGGSIFLVDLVALIVVAPFRTLLTQDGLVPLAIKTVVYPSAFLFPMLFAYAVSCMIGWGICGALDKFVPKSN